MRVKRTKPSLRSKATTQPVRSKKAAVADTSKPVAWATSVGAIVLAVLFVVVALAMLTVPEGNHRLYVDGELPPAEVMVEPVAQERSAASNEPLEPSQQRIAAVTIAGCLEREEGTFRLTDPSGADAPTSRSWKSGFLKKRPVQIAVADAVGTLNLRNHVGQRVAATGTLVDREMRARSVRRVGACG